MREINAADLQRQISREGRRLGLVPRYDRELGKVFVAERSRHMAGRGCLQTVEKLTDICSVDMDHPISVVGKFRRRRFERSLLQRIRETRAARAAQVQRDADDRWQAYRGDLLRGFRELGPQAFAQAAAEVIGVRSHRR